MVKRKQHYVPRFYLDLFESAPERIHLFNLERGLKRCNVGIKGQCYRRYFYGKDPEIEEQLSELEGAFSAVLQQIGSDRRLPSVGSDEYRTLLTFISLQFLRTQKWAAEMGHIHGKVLQRAFGDQSNVPDEFNFERLEIVKMSLSFASEMIATIEDLNSHLVESGDGSFIVSDAPILKYNQYCEGITSFASEMIATIEDLNSHLVESGDGSFIVSDAPILKYNQYCEGITFQGTTGLESKGLQIFVPLSPALVLILYDGDVYRVRSSADRQDRRTRTNRSSDIDQLNILQLLTAERNVYFSHIGQFKNIERLLPRYRDIRIEDPQVVLEVGQDDVLGNSLLHSFSRPINASLNLSFLIPKKGAGHIALHKRAELSRDGSWEARRALIRKMGGNSVTFSRFLGKS